MTGKATYRVRTVLFPGEGFKVLSYVIGGDFYDIPGLLRSERMNLDYPWYSVTRVDVGESIGVHYELVSCGTLPIALVEGLAATPEALWNELDEFVS